MIYRNVQLTPEQLKAQAQLDGRKIPTSQAPDGHGDKQQTEIFNPYKQGNPDQSKLF